MHHSKTRLSITALGFTSEIEKTSHRAFIVADRFLRKQNKMQVPSKGVNVFQNNFPTATLPVDFSKSIQVFKCFLLKSTLPTLTFHSSDIIL